LALRQCCDSLDEGLDVELAPKTVSAHVTHVAENRPLFPGPVVKPEQPGDVGMGVRIATVNEIYPLTTPGAPLR